MSLTASPGETLVVRQILPQEHAVKLGRGLVSALDPQWHIRMQMAGRIHGECSEVTLDPETDALLADVLTTLDSIVRNIRSPRKDVSATYMSTPTKQFQWHVDPEKHIRACIKLGEGESGVWLGKKKGVFCSDKDYWLKGSPKPEDKMWVPLAPGDGYILDNRVDKIDRRPHATEVDEQGRCMLRVSYFDGSYGVVPPFTYEDLQLDEDKIQIVAAAL